jgi:hypothetical protein
MSVSCEFVDVGRSLTRVRVCRLQLLLAFASAVIFGSEFRGTRDHILLSQIRYSPFRRLLLLTGLRWRYLISPPHGNPWIGFTNELSFITSREPSRSQHIRQFVFWSPASVVTETHGDSKILFPWKPCLLIPRIHGNCWMFVDMRKRFSEPLPSKWTSSWMNVGGYHRPICSFLIRQSQKIWLTARILEFRIRIFTTNMLLLS